MTKSEREELIAIGGRASSTFGLDWNGASTAVLEAIEAEGFVIAKPASDEEISNRLTRLTDYVYVSAELGEVALAVEPLKADILALIASRTRPVVTEQMVEKAAVTIHYKSATDHVDEWEDCDKWIHEACRRAARAVLESALGDGDKT